MASGTKVFVGCKLPNGMIMELVTPHEMKTSLLPAPVGHRVVLKGANSSRIARTNPADAPYGVTEVDKEFADKWFERNKNLKFIKDKHVFKADTLEELQGEANDMLILNRTGMEPLKTDGTDPRQPAGVEADKKHLASLGVMA